MIQEIIYDIFGVSINEGPQFGAIWESYLDGDGNTKFRCYQYEYQYHNLNGHRKILLFEQVQNYLRIYNIEYINGIQIQRDRILFEKFEDIKQHYNFIKNVGSN